DTINAVDGERDYIDCGPGADRAVVDKFDKLSNCEVVDTRASPKDRRRGARTRRGAASAPWRAPCTRARAAASPRASSADGPPERPCAIARARAARFLRRGGRAPSPCSVRVAGARR